MTPYEHRLETVIETLLRSTARSMSAVEEQAREILHAIDTIPEKVR